MTKEIQVRVLPHEAATQSLLTALVARELGIDARTVRHLRVLRRSIDARQRTIYVNLTLRVYINEEPSDDAFVRTEYGDVSKAPQAIVVGEGPGGLFAALRLIELGVRPVILERGKNVADRRRDVADISRSHKVDGESNYCFGEGGAGAYSDGKLYTRSKKRGSVEKILNVFCQHGASTDILADAHPHIGTDKLPLVIAAMRDTILRCGGAVHHQTKMTRLLLEGDEVKGVEAVDLANGGKRLFHGPVILATGHSARDVYRYLDGAGIELEAKGLAIGVRLEHPSHLIDQIQYHNAAGRGEYLPAAEYSFVTQVDGRGVYSFCMCPGGFVIPAATGPHQLVVNGMSPSNRGSKWSNSGMVVEVRPEDVSGDSPLRMMTLQERIEEECWRQGGCRQTAPAQRMVDFVEGRQSHDLPRSSYSPGLVISKLHEWLPRMVATRLRKGFQVFGARSKGFLTNEAVLIAAETRTSSPVRVVRLQDTLQHVRLRGLFPCGEGAGYAGGIVSAAIDGERCAEKCAELLIGEKSRF